jgi:hypothetical protein
VLMVANVIVWDIETVPDIKRFAAGNGHDGKSDDEIRAAMGDKFPKHIYHSIICIESVDCSRGRWPMGDRCSGSAALWRAIRKGVDRILRRSNCSTDAAARDV